MNMFLDRSCWASQSRPEPEGLRITRQVAYPSLCSPTLQRNVAEKVKGRGPLLQRKMCILNKAE
jgi:hypothetical protein